MVPHLDWESLYERDYGHLLRRALSVHGITIVDAKMVEERLGSHDRVTLWLVTDAGLVAATFRPGDRGERLPSVATNLTAWTDVHDVELDTDIAEMSAVDKDNPLGYAYQARLTIQLPRLSLEKTGDDAVMLAAFGTAIARRVQ